MGNSHLRVHPEQGQLGAATALLILRREKQEGRCRDRPMDVRVGSDKQVTDEWIVKNRQVDR